ncbi:MAG TPA: hypothetical protein VGM53_28025 [Streptosporangiaceae bacterium]
MHPQQDFAGPEIVEPGTVPAGVAGEISRPDAGPAACVQHDRRRFAGQRRVHVEPEVADRAGRGQRRIEQVTGRLNQGRVLPARAGYGDPRPAGSRCPDALGQRGREQAGS